MALDLAPPSLIWSSPYARALRTAQLLAEVAGRDVPVEVVTALAPAGAGRALEQRIARAPDGVTLVLVGHQPDLGLMAARFGRGGGPALELKKAGACSLAFEGAMHPGAGTLEWFMTPRILRALGRRARRA